MEEKSRCKKLKRWIMRDFADDDRRQTTFNGNSSGMSPALWIKLKRESQKERYDQNSPTILRNRAIARATQKHNKTIQRQQHKIQQQQNYIEREQYQSQIWTEDIENYTYYIF